MVTVSLFLPKGIPKFNFYRRNNSAKNVNNNNRNGDDTDDIESLSTDFTALRLNSTSSSQPLPRPPLPPNVGPPELVCSLTGCLSGPRSASPPPGALPSVLRAPRGPGVGPFSPPLQIVPPVTLSTHGMAAKAPFQSDKSASALPVSNHQIPIGGPSPVVAESYELPRPTPSSSVVFYKTCQSQPVKPPSVTSAYFVKDTGNCSPLYMRSTLNQILCTNDLLKLSSMPLSLIVQPLPVPHPFEEPIQVVDFGQSGPVRCSCCEGYINPYIKFIHQGKRFICNLCCHVNETPGDYYCNLRLDGRRLDTDDRPEICNGTIEFVPTEKNMSGATAAACSAVKQVIVDLHPSMLIIPDIQDVYTSQTDVIVNLSEQYGNPLSKKLNDLINGIRYLRSSYLCLRFCKKGGPSGALFKSYMVEDEDAENPSYREFLGQIHKQIQS